MSNRISPSILALLLPAILAAGALPAHAQIPGGALFDSLTSRPQPEPERIEFQQVFLEFEQSVPHHPSKRSRATADSLAHALLTLAREGAPFDTLVAKHGSDRPPARYRVTRQGIRPGTGERSRKSFEDAVGEMAFGLAPGETGLVAPNNTTCRYGYYVIRRIH